MQYITNYATPLGEITLSCDGENLTGLWFNGQKHFGYKLPSNHSQNDNLKIFDDTKNWLARYFDKKNPHISELPLKPIGTDFQKEVWSILCKISYGKAITYGEISKEIAGNHGIKKMSARAVGSAVGKNPISIIIPCHRVIGSNGNLTGYAGGLERKIKLLELETYI